jgi:hypothetical protein
MPVYRITDDMSVSVGAMDCEQSGIPWYYTYIGLIQQSPICYLAGCLRIVSACVVVLLRILKARTPEHTGAVMWWFTLEMVRIRAQESIGG